MNELDKSKKWPIVKYNSNDEPYFLFLLTPPYSGSTAMAQLINTSHKTMVLNKNGEGQWLIPGLSDKDRWSVEKKDSLRVNKICLVSQISKHKWIG